MENNIFPIARTYFHVIPQMAWLGLFSICLYLFIEHARALGLGPILFRTPIQERAQQHINRPFFFAGFQLWGLNPSLQRCKQVRYTLHRGLSGWKLHS